MNAEEEANYFDSVVNTAEKGHNSDPKYNNRENDYKTFTELSLSRPILRGVEAAGYTTPTPVQVSIWYSTPNCHLLLIALLMLYIIYIILSSTCTYAYEYICDVYIQSAVLPLALAGRDVCASAATGSGKVSLYTCLLY